MKDKPILFSAPMVRALLNGSKTMTRRIVKPQPEYVGCVSPLRDPHLVDRMYRLPGDPSHISYTLGAILDRIKPPYAVGDTLWAREAWRFTPEWMPGESNLCGCGDGECNECWQSPAVLEVAIDYSDAEAQLVNAPEHYVARYQDSDGLMIGKWRPSIHMPRWASRISLLVTEVRVERVQDISINDALKEGIICPACGYRSVDASEQMDHALCVSGWLKASKAKDVGDHPAIAAFRTLWDSIHGPGAWERNDWVWVVGFEVVRQASERPADTGIERETARSAEEAS
jgi:hypothetical protein